MKKILMVLALAASLTACANINEKENVEKPKLEAVKEDSSKEDVDASSSDEEKVQSDSEENTQLEKHTENVYEYFDTVTTFLAYTKDQEEFDKYVKVLRDELKTYHELYNSYDAFEGVNNFRTINENAGKEPVKVALCQHFH